MLTSIVCHVINKTKNFWEKNIVTIMLKHDLKKKLSFIVVPLIKRYTYKC